MQRVKTSSPLIAILYEAGADAAPLMQRIVAYLQAQGVHCAGFVQHDVERTGRTRCDMMLKDITTGESLPISDDRGPGARGCQLDEAQLIRAMTRAIDGLDAQPQVLVLNKFGKSEAEGRGFRNLIAAAVERDVPVIVPVPWRNAESWQQFAGALSAQRELTGISTLPDAAVVRALGITLATTAPLEVGALA